MFGTPLAFYNLFHDRRRLAVAVAGVTFAVVLMFMQLGFQNALFDSNVEILRRLNADLILVNSAQPSLPDQRRIPRAYLSIARGCEGVAKAYPFYTERVLSKLSVPNNPKVKGDPIRVLAFRLGDPVFRPSFRKTIDSYLRRLERPDTALYDAFSKPVFGFPQSPSTKTAAYELAGKSITLVGTFTQGADFSNHGNLIMSAENMARVFPYRGFGRPLEVMDLGLVKIDDGEDPQVVKKRLQAVLPPDTAVFTHQGLIRRETSFWRTNTPIGKIFFIGVVIGLIVGVAICYQIIYADISDHIAEFATLRAMGYTWKYFVLLVSSMAFYLSLLGFLPGWLISWGAYWVVREQTKLLMQMSLPVMAQVYCLTLLMCLVSGGFAIRKVISVDPAELY